MCVFRQRLKYNVKGGCLLIKKNEMGGEYSTYGGGKGCIRGFGGETGGKSHLDVVGIDGKIILK